MHIPANAILTVTLIALLSSHLRFATEQYWIRVKAWTRLVASIVLVGGGIYLGQQGWRHGAEDLYLRRASAAPNFSPASVVWLKKAFAAEPKNSETAYAIGEAFRVQSSEGARNYGELATQAMEWFGRSFRLNRWGGSSYLGYGWCLDWMDRSAESQPYFDHAVELDPNGFFTLANVGLHYVQLGNYAAAKPWFERSLHLEWKDNLIAETYLQIARTRLLEAATNGNTTRLDAPMP